METATVDVPHLAMHDGRTIPQLGFGVFLVEESDAQRVVEEALAAGYRHIDTAMIYRNEAGVGRAIAASGIPREEIFVTTKAWNDDQGHEEAIRACEASLDRLGLGHVDLYLIHWPSPWRTRYVETWRALVELREQGRATSIGVSNFEPAHLDAIISDSGVVPVVNQVELHPYLQQRELRELHARHGIVTEAWSPIGQGGPLLADPVIATIAAELGATPAQVVLAWQLALGNVAIPKTSRPERMRENIAAAAISLGAGQLEAINALDRDGRIGPHPDTATF